MVINSGSTHKKLGYLEQFLFNFQLHADGSAKQIRISLAHGILQFT